MIVYKGMREDMTCTQGRGKFQYHLGETIREDRAKTAAAGLHCTENPFLVLHWTERTGIFSVRQPEASTRTRAIIKSLAPN